MEFASHETGMIFIIKNMSIEVIYEIGSKKAF